MFEEQNYGKQSIGMEISQRYIPLIERLEKERDQVQQKLDNYNAAIDALKKNPEFEALFNTLGKAVNRF